MRQTDEKALVEAFRRIEPWAFAEAEKRFGGMMLAMAIRVVGPARAPDVVQDAWLLAVRHAPKFEGRCALSSWLCHVTTNAALMVLRWNKRHPALSIEDGEAKHRAYQSPSHLPAPDHRIETHEEAIAGLQRVRHPARRRALLAWASGRGDIEDARITGLPLSTIKSHRRRARDDARSRVVA